ncbi:4'-phosphopantetheinyl transferase family protein [Shewanella sp. 125m-7]
MSEFTSIKLFFCPLSTADLDVDSAALIKSWLPQDEVDKVNRYIKQEAKDQGLMVRGFLRALLSQQVSQQVSKQANLRPDEWCFEYGDKGKPRLTDAQFKQTGIHFNLSHSGDWLLVGICQPSSNTQYYNAADAVEFGVDIERCRSSTNIHSILSHYFSELEKAALLGLPQELQRARFFDLWALKESYIKAKGLGLALSLKSFAFDFSSLVETSLQLDRGQSNDGMYGTESIEEEITGTLANHKHIRLKQNISLATQQETTEKLERHKASENTGESRELRRCEQQMQAAKGWHCCLGHLDDSYRFAVSIGQCQQVDIEANEVSLKSLLAL